MEFHTLICTNVLSRGFDVPEVDLVINLDLPRKRDEAGFYEPDYENFLHRVGRTGRFGTDGVALTIYKDGELNKVNEETNTEEDFDEKPMITKIEKFYNINIEENKDLTEVSAKIQEMRNS
jgi:superfamily II DNA/RNA helicase